LVLHIRDDPDKKKKKNEINEKQLKPSTKWSFLTCSDCVQPHLENNFQRKIAFALRRENKLKLFHNNDKKRTRLYLSFLLILIKMTFKVTSEIEKINHNLDKTVNSFECSNYM
jgi:hypothetical protein